MIIHCRQCTSSNTEPTRCGDITTTITFSNQQLPTRPEPFIFAHDKPIRSKAILVNLEDGDPRHEQPNDERGAHRRSLHPLLHAPLHPPCPDAGLVVVTAPFAAAIVDPLRFRMIRYFGATGI